MVKLIAPVQSFEARGKLGSTVFGTWRGINVARAHFIPANPQTAGQVNIRAAMSISVASWQSETAPNKLTWDTQAKGEPLSGFNLFVKTALDAYMTQLGTGVLPTSVTQPGAYPGTFTWT